MTLIFLVVTLDGVVSESRSWKRYHIFIRLLLKFFCLCGLICCIWPNLLGITCLARIWTNLLPFRFQKFGFWQEISEVPGALLKIGCIAINFMQSSKMCLYLPCEICLLTMMYLVRLLRRYNVFPEVGIKSYVAKIQIVATRYRRSYNFEQSCGASDSRYIERLKSRPLRISYM